MKTKSLIFLSTLLFFTNLHAASKTNETYFAKFHPLKSPPARGLVLKQNDKLAICGDSITEQKMYSRIIETYLTVCTPELNITARQYGWGGEQASGFLGRMTNDVLRFHPTIATTCYGMNDHHYQPYEESIGAAYRSNSLAIIRAFKNEGTRVILGSPGCMGDKPAWAWIKGTADERNQNLCELRNIDVQLAKNEKVHFADVFWPMLVGYRVGKDKYGAQFELAGKDTVHPGWAGHLVMAYAFLKAMGVDGDIGTYTVDLKSGKAKVSKGHELISSRDGEIKIKSSRYPFCAKDDATSDNSIRAGMTIVPFNQEFNRLMLVVKNAGASKKYKVTWGAESHSYTGAQLKNGINLAEEFQANPFLDNFSKVDQAVAAKQDYETKQIKQIFHGKDAEKNMDALTKQTEAERAPLADAIKTAFVPVTHTIRIVAE